MRLRDRPDMDFPALQAKAAKLPVRTRRLEHGSGGWMVNGKFFDENVVNAAIPMGSEEVWVMHYPGRDRPRQSPHGPPAERRHPRPEAPFMEVHGVRLHDSDRGEGRPIVLIRGTA
jgi:hypothetical protein